MKIGPIEEVAVADRREAIRPYGLPLPDLEVGHGITVDDVTQEDNAFRGAVSLAGKRLGRTFSVKKLGAGSFRVWRRA